MTSGTSTPSIKMPEIDSKIEEAFIVFYLSFLDITITKPTPATNTGTIHDSIPCAPATRTIVESIVVIEPAIIGEQSGSVPPDPVGQDLNDGAHNFSGVIVCISLPDIRVI